MAPTSGWLIDAFPLFHFSLGLVFAGVCVDVPAFPRSRLNITLICSNEIKVHPSGAPGRGHNTFGHLYLCTCWLLRCRFIPPKNHSECECV